ncbi:uncharacterized protein GGS22DRAFT_193116 [Annulohypoxylon maeteangense]|uniref:uncharacterized protein n=1 Tax=Annulohypoxylon maeteangense TaxID=1927788 RepID=UPI002008B642|nr:uncharacterized protein GGS22DRAFT_193116 [Annulohypoxylon maeteangense]KAI0880538.1 hypothetical protein GGS22DRAFT_193116 [Annulohypoxylon maeteangense]
MWPVSIASVAATLFITGITVGGFTIPSSCPDIPSSRYPFELAKGWAGVKVADGLHSPRGLVIDGEGRLLVVEEGLGISQHTVDTNGCIKSSRVLISMSALNHGIYLGKDDDTLYASSASAVFKWAYDPKSGNTTGSPVTIISGMSSEDHVSRTLIISPNHPNLLVVSRGSNSNLDYATVDPSTARSIVKVFDIMKVPNGGYDYVKDGWNAGYGLRNEVGLVFDGNNMLWGVENSADQLTREENGTSTDIHTDNPAEKLNFLGDIATPNNAWYGYPTCFAIWRPDPAIVDSTTMQEVGVGQQFVLAPNKTFNDTTCAKVARPPRLVFEAHTAPLDAKFDMPKYENMFVTMHGSWDRNPPVGYKLVAVPFTHASQGGYDPVAPANSNTGYVDIFYPPNEGNCSSSTCIRPVGLVFDAAGRLYMTSDTSGEVFMLGRSN